MLERRKYPRYEIDNKCLIRKEKAVGTIIDLSLGGLSCSCCSSNFEDCANRHCDNIDIYCVDKKIWVRGLAMVIVASEKNPGQFLDNFWTRKCRARFKNLREDQIAQLENMIRCLADQ